MANSTEDGNRTATQELFCSQDYGTPEKILHLTLTLPISITAFLGNALIIVALQKVSSLHPPSKLLLGCLACTDLGVGLISQPLFSGFYLSPEHSKSCYYLWIIFYIVGGTISGVSLLTVTAISVDRLLALLLGLRYRQVVTVRRVWALVVSFWLFCIFAAMTGFYMFRITTGIAGSVLVLSILISVFCYTKIYFTLRLDRTQVLDQFHQGQPNGGGIPLNKARYKKTVSAALWVQGALLACYLPFGLVTSFITIKAGLNSPALKFVWALTVSLLSFNSTLNPFLYCWKMREMRQAVKDTIRKFCCLSHEAN